MNKTLALLGFISLILVGCNSAKQVTQGASKSQIPAGITLVESQSDKKQQTIGIEYSKYRLENGLTLILHHDDSDPLVHVDVTYHVGSAREDVGKSGFAHFFEHMMFQGSKHVADEQHFKIITEAGGTLNGTTNSDRTNYYQTVPANQLEKVLWLEADRMGFLLETVTQEKFEIQRATVKNERGESYDNRPYGLRSERNSEALYPAGHPYSWSTIGYVEDLDRVTVDDLKAFFKRWYGPNNAVLTIGGDIDKHKTLAWVEKYFGSIPAGPEVKPANKAVVQLEQDRYVTLEDDVYLPLIQITYPTVHVRHKDEAPLDVLSDILGGGKTSLFYKNLVKDNHAVQAVVSHPCQELACEFQLIALPNPSKSPSLSQMQAKIEATLVEFEQRGVKPDDLARTKANIESSTVFGLQSVAGKVSTLAMNQIFNQQPDLVQYDLDRYNAVTEQDVMRVYRQYIKGNAKVVLSIVPAGQTELAAKAPNFTPPERQISQSSPPPEQQDVTITDTFDRSVMPKAGPIPTVTIPDYSKTTFENGMQLLSHYSNETPTVTLLLSLEGGPLLDPIEKAGLASLTARMMNETTELMSNEQMANQLALLGSQVSFSAAGRYTQVRVNSLVDNLDETLAILKAKLFAPAFLEQDFARIKQSLAQQMQQQIKDPGVLASKAVDLLMYGDQNRVSLPDIGTLQTLQNIQLDDVKQFYQQYYSPTKANVVVVGDISAKQLNHKLGFLAEWQGNEFSIPDYAAFPEYQTSKIYLVDKPDAAQSIVRMVKRSAPYDATGEHFKSKLMNFPLGGMFNSRISLNLREDKGYTYGASSYFVGGKTLGRFVVASDLKQQNTADGIAELLGEITRYHENGMTQAELISMRSAYTQSEALNYETPYNKATFLNHLMTYELPRGYREEQTQIINQISTNELNELAQELLNPQQLQIVVVGDAKVIKPQLATLDREIISFELQQ